MDNEFTRAGDVLSGVRMAERHKVRDANKLCTWSDCIDVAIKRADDMGEIEGGS